jgi:hypothetical protein
MSLLVATGRVITCEEECMRLFFKTRTGATRVKESRVARGELT